MRSGVNWMRLVSSCRVRLRVRTSSVLATPGTPSSSTWPPTSSEMMRPVTAPSCPTTALPTSLRTRANMARSSVASTVTADGCSSVMRSFSRVHWLACGAAGCVVDGGLLEDEQVVGQLDEVAVGRRLGFQQQPAHFVQALPGDGGGHRGNLGDAGGA